MAGMLLSPVSSLRGKENGQRKRTRRIDRRRRGSPTHRPPLHHTIRSQEEREKTDMFPQSASSMRQAEISPLPPAYSDHPPALSSGNFPISFPFLKGAVPYHGLQRFGENMVSDDAVGW